MTEQDKVFLRQMFDDPLDVLTADEMLADLKGIYATATEVGEREEAEQMKRLLADQDLIEFLVGLEDEYMFSGLDQPSNN